jgi:hypothetical protein
LSVELVERGKPALYNVNGEDQGQRRKPALYNVNGEDQGQRGKPALYNVNDGNLRQRSKLRSTNSGRDAASHHIFKLNNRPASRSSVG